MNALLGLPVGATLADAWAALERVPDSVRGILYVRFLSWHILDSTYRRTLCGRVPSTAAEVSETLPATKSCESCLRIFARRQS